MVIAVKTTDDYFNEKRHDLLILEMRVKRDVDGLFLRIDREACENAAEPQLSWWRDRGVNVYYTVDPGTLVGWHGHYFIDIDPDDPLVVEYTSEWETPQGESKNPQVYQTLCVSYSEWLSNGGHEQYQKHQLDMQDPDYEP